jgi:hypothetical protein
MLIVFTRIQSPTSTIQREFQIAYPTVTVILILTSIPTLLEIWWLVVVLDAFWSERAEKRYDNTNDDDYEAITDLTICKAVFKKTLQRFQVAQIFD